MPENGRTRIQKIIDAALISAVGMVIAALILGFCGVVWSAASDLGDMKSDFKASQKVFLDQLAQVKVDLERQSVADARLAKLESQANSVVSRIDDHDKALEDLMVAIDNIQDKTPELASALKRYSDSRAQAEEQVQLQEQPQQLAPNMPMPDIGDKYHEAVREMQEQIQQQREFTK